MKANDCLLCLRRPTVDQPLRGFCRPWNISCDKCGIVLFGSEGESKTSVIHKWNRLHATPENKNP